MTSSWSGISAPGTRGAILRGGGRELRASGGHHHSRGGGRGRGRDLGRRRLGQHHGGSRNCMRKMYKNVMIIANNIIFMNYGLYIATRCQINKYVNISQFHCVEIGVTL